MKSKTVTKPTSAKGAKKQSKPPKQSSELHPNKLSLFDHVKHIRSVQDPKYYSNLSEENRKSFNHFMLLRALSMDDEVVGEMAFLYRYFDKIPSPQFYQLLIALVPKSNRWVPWIKTKVVKHNQDLLELVAKTYSVSKRQANEYINVLIATEEGLQNLVGLCSAMGLSDSEVEGLFDKKD